MFGEWFLGGVYDPDAVEFANRSGMNMLDFAMCFATAELLAKGPVAARDRRCRRARRLHHTASELGVHRQP